MQNDYLFPRFSCGLQALYNLISAIILFNKSNAVDGCGDYAPTKPVDIWSCMGGGGLWGPGANSRSNIYSVPGFILDIHACYCV